MHPSFDVTFAEIEYIIKTEMVEQPLDLIVRRLRITFYDADISYEILPIIVDIFG